MKWSNDRFSIMTTTMWSMPEAAGAGSAVVEVVDVEVAAEAIVGRLEKGSLVSAAVPPTTAAAPRNCRRVTIMQPKVWWSGWFYQALQRSFTSGSPWAGGSVRRHREVPLMKIALFVTCLGDV